ncbi:MAG: phosphoribosyl-AMP cyclohydrolase [Gammaproteobacteria bacterium]|jgi:phosphoribosyl-AMP cyclohydrolase|nr:phosphoribosyl-AMP cyclohydrolase [Gammaproteobacteria bacterium]MBT5205402.1 phosphoribosyl-AMP cyclohydrolase [Gammaproteobacteria bacterium]MBT5604141.1 phosphoribosyl-AMP cyclohydrolase [Gammaproteobacteria bacterium]MBT6245138.1 phosphoribosyl-AMP cyclohydrolase [Gammaproteobacteria bacterium]
MKPNLYQPAYFNDLTFNDDGLIPAIAQDKSSGKILMLAWMNREAVSETISTGQAVYWSRSRQMLWRKGESSGHYQQIDGIYLDCDGDVLILSVEQIGGIACHTGRRSCFFRKLINGSWQDVESVLKDPAEIYKGE